METITQKNNIKVFFVGLSFCVEIVNFTKIEIGENYVVVNNNEISLKLPSHRIKIEREIVER